MRIVANPQASPDEVPALKDEASQHAIATAWRDTLEALVSALAKDDFGLIAALPNVQPVSSATEAYVRNAIRDYRRTLTELPQASWQSSVCMWYRTHWDVLVDLWTKEEGPSDLVMKVRVVEKPDGFSYELEMVYVP